MEAIIRVMFECQQVLGSHITAATSKIWRRSSPFRLRARSYQRLIIRLKIKKPVLNPYSSSMTPREKFYRRKNEEQRHKAHHAQRVAERNGGAALPQPPKA